MANPQLKRQAQPHSRSNATQSEANVSGCVSNLIQAFTNSLDVFKRLRERRRKRKHSKQQSAAEKARQYSGDELQLSNSLRRGPQDIQDVYEKCYGRAGERFAKGDGMHFPLQLQSNSPNYEETNKPIAQPSHTPPSQKPSLS